MENRDVGRRRARGIGRGVAKFRPFREATVADAKQVPDGAPVFPTMPEARMAPHLMGHRVVVVGPVGRSIKH